MVRPAAPTRNGKRAPICCASSWRQPRLAWRARDAEADPRALDILRRHSAHDAHMHQIAATAST
jgi:hypothetical protein